MRILLLANNVAGLISFRFEVVKAIIEQGISQLFLRLLIKE